MRVLALLLFLIASGGSLIYLSWGDDEGNKPTPTIPAPTATPVTSPTIAATAVVEVATATNASTAVAATPSVTPIKLNIKTGYSVLNFSYRGARRVYGLYIPETYDGVKEFPLLVGFHPLNGTTESFAIGMGWLAPAQEKQWIGLYPQGVITPNEQAASWNAWHCCGYAFDKDFDDVGFVRALVAEIRKQYKVDAKRIYAVGYSNGGDMAHYVGSELSEVFAAIGEYAGALGSDPQTPNIVYPKPKNSVSVIKLHGKKDTVRPYNGGWDGGHWKQYVSVNEAMRFWATADGCGLTPTISKIEGATWETYEGCKNKTAVMLIAYDNADHNYPTSATKLIVQFLAAQSKP